jgi:hypothetical protein
MKKLKKKGASAIASNLQYDERAKITLVSHYKNV